MSVVMVCKDRRSHLIRPGAGLWLGALLLMLIAQAHAAWPPPVPAQCVLQVRNDAAVARSNEVVRGGVPLPRELGLTSTAGFAVVNGAGQPVPASFRVLARWNAAVDDTSAPIQWLLLRFVASVPALSSAQYTLKTDASVINPAPPLALTLSQSGNQFSIDTGAARFVLGANAGAVVDRIERPGAVVLVDGSQLAATVDGSLGAGFSSIRRVQIEQADALSAVLLVDGVYAHAAIGGGAISGGRRLEFQVGAPYVTVREWIDWEGEHCSLGLLNCGGAPNAVALQRWRVGLTTALSGARSVSALAEPNIAAASAAIGAGESASLRQLRRAQRLAPSQYQLSLPGQSLSTGARADTAGLVLSGANGHVGVALAQMADFEPQALRVLSDGQLALDLADDGVWLGTRQGTYAEYRVGVWPTAEPVSGVLSSLRSSLDYPLVALPTASWMAASRATDEFPVGTLPPALQSYDTLLDDLLQRTLDMRQSRGLQGLLTHGLYPRAWGNPVLSEEIDCGDNDPTPGSTWDNSYWCATWTDYHNVSQNARVQAWRSGDPRALQRIAVPAALRMLHTQMLRCAPDDNYFYCGQMPAGYGGFRADFNSSHAYVENQIHQYWASGDRTIVERLTQGARTRRGYLCAARGSQPPGPVCAPGAPITDEFAGLNDRVAVQGYQIFRFVGLAGDASYLDDWRSNSARFLTQNFALLQQGGQTLGFTEPSGAGDTSIIGAPGSYYTTQLWMAALYDFNQLYRLEIDSQDAPLGIPALSPSSARHGYARTLAAAASVAPGGSGGAAGVWPNELRYTFSGARIGGNLDLLEPGWAPGQMPNECLDRCLYDSGKAALSATLARSADDLSDPALHALALDLTQFALQAISQQPQPMNKATGIFFGRLASAVARLAAGPTADALYANGFEQ